jgi:hypothetical protein
LNLSDLVYLLNAATAFSKSLTPSQSRLFCDAVRAAVETLERDDDADRISDEASYLQSLGKQLGVNLDADFDTLMERAGALEERESHRSRRSAPKEYGNELAREFDIDEHFKGLLDRHG